ncbi:MAG TPA: spore coat associated protein CotJA [Bacillota bacterium]|nr:spore coat associated protein CotJA [Bacillota bacterium]
MNNIESQMRNLRNEGEPYVGMTLKGFGDSGCQKCPQPEYTRPECMESACSAVDSCQLAMAYVPWQRFCKTYELAEGHRRGTIFPELDFPWVGGGAC